MVWRIVGAARTFALVGALGLGADGVVVAHGTTAMADSTTPSMQVQLAYTALYTGTVNGYWEYAATSDGPSFRGEPMQFGVQCYEWPSRYANQLFGVLTLTEAPGRFIEGYFESGDKYQDPQSMLQVPPQSAWVTATADENPAGPPGPVGLGGPMTFPQLESCTVPAPVLKGTLTLSSSGY
jgi:hypothetical protein